ncbi:hypothetical protein JCM8547_002264 [Rhodosporidiobolus lusitaniae]
MKSGWSTAGLGEHESANPPSGPEMTSTVSLEPLRLYAHDGKDADLFAKPARLHSVNLEDGKEIFTREDPKKSLTERLMRVWAERGDYSLLTEESIRNKVEEDEKDKEDEDTRPSPEDIRKLQDSMLNSLNIARGELTTALDLLSVLSVPTDPPDVDVNSIPLPQQTLTFVPTAVPPPPATDPSVNPLAALPVAQSLDALKSSAQAFFTASEDLIPLDQAELAALAASSPSASRPRPRTRAPDPWNAILQLHATSPRTLLPLGALPGASLTGKGETRTARQIGVFFGCEETKEPFRSAAIARVGEIVEEGAKDRTGRKLVVEVETEGGGLERTVWNEQDEGKDAVERTLRARGRAAFAEDLFAQLSSEARADAGLRAQLKLGTKSEGDSVVTEGNGWTLRVKLVISPPSAIPSAANPSASILLPILRLLYLQEYAARRSPSSLTSRPLLPTLSACLNYLRRFGALKATLIRLRQRVENSDVPVELEFVGASGEVEENAAGAVVQILEGKKELGGRVALRVGKSHLFHVFHSYPLPTSSPALPSVLPPPQPSLTLRIPNKQPIPIPSLRHLETFLEEQVDLAIKLAKRPAKEVNGDAMST